MKYLILGLFLVCVACNRTDFPKYSLVSGLRILTIKAMSDQGEVNLGTTVTLQPVVSDIGAGGRTLTATVTACLDPGNSIGEQPTCTNPDTSSTSTFSTTTLSSNGTYTGAAPTFTVTVPASLPVFSASPAYLRYNGVAYTVIYTLTAPDGNSTTAIKRIMISDSGKTIKNKNPAIASVTANGAALSATQAYSTSSLDLGIALSTGAETYQTMDPSGTLSSHSENVTTTWYFTDGEMKHQRTVGADSNHWDASKPSSRATALIVVVTDGRGGEDYSIFEFN